MRVPKPCLREAVCGMYKPKHIYGESNNSYPMSNPDDEPGKISLLYVDDEPALLELTRRFLERIGNFVVTTAPGAPEAIGILDEERFDAIVSDYEMCGMNGVELLKYVRERGSNIPFLIFTGKGREEVVIEAMDNGADFYVQKGGDPRSQFTELTNKISYAVSRRQAEEALRLSEGKYRFIADNVADNIWMFDMAFNLQYVSPACEKMRGYTVEEDMAQTLEEKMTPASCELVVKRFEEELALEATGTADPERFIVFETEEYCKDGSTIFVENSVRCLWDSHGQPEGVIGVSRDITWRRQAEESLRRSEERYRSLAENSPIGIITCDGQGVVEYANPKACSMLGEEVGDTVNPVNMCRHPVFEETGLAGVIQTALATGAVDGPVECACRQPDGNEVRVRVTLSLLAGNGSVEGAQMILEEILPSQPPGAL